MRDLDPIADAWFERFLQARLSAPAEEVCPGLELVAFVEQGGADDQLEAAAREHLLSCAICAEALRDLRAIDRPAENVRTGWTWPKLAWAAVALVLISIGAWQIWVFSGTQPSGQHQLVTKGADDQIAVAVERRGSRFVIGPEDRLEAGDRLGFFYSTSRPGYLALFALDSSRSIDLLYPAGPAESGSVDAGQDVRMPDGGIWRPGSGCEWLVGVFSDRPLAIDALRDALKDAIVAGSGCRLRPELPEARTLWLQRVR